jgi:hypothetical protein
MVADAMTIPDIQRAVWDFLENYIDTVPQLEALLLIYGMEERLWKAEDIATRIYISAESALDILETLKRRALIGVGEGAFQYRRNPPTDEKTVVISAVADAYRRHLVPIATFIHSKAPASIREFARAFELKKDR